MGVYFKAFDKRLFKIKSKSFGVKSKNTSLDSEISKLNLGSVTDVSDQWVLINMRGKNVFEILSKGSAILGIFIGNKKYQGKNLFFKILKVLEPKLIILFKINLLYLGVNKNNFPAIKAFKKSGFKVYNWKKKKIYNQLIMKKTLSL